MNITPLNRLGAGGVRYLPKAHTTMDGVT